MKRLNLDYEVPKIGVWRSDEDETPRERLDRKKRESEGDRYYGRRVIVNDVRESGEQP